MEQNDNCRQSRALRVLTRSEHVAMVPHTLNHTEVEPFAGTPAWYSGCAASSSKLLIGSVCFLTAVKAMRFPEKTAARLTLMSQKHDKKSLRGVSAGGS